MTYDSTADVAESGSLTRRVTACVALEGQESPEVWTYQNRWGWAAAPGWGEAFASAQAAGNPDPGADEAVITDAMILTQVQAMRGA